MRQRGTVEEYVQEFEMLVAQAIVVMEDQLFGYFFARLQGRLQNQIRPHDM